MSSRSTTKIKLSSDDRLFYTVSYILLGLLLIIISYPLIYVVSSSFSAPSAVLAGKVVLWPVDPSLEGYQAIFRNKYIGIGYFNSFFYTIVGTVFNVALTLMTAYPLTRKEMPFNKFITFLFTFTMFFSGGMIPTYMLMSTLKLLDTRWIMIISGFVSVYNMIITRTFIQSSIPNELFEAAQIDGCSYLKYFIVMVLPLSKAVIAVISLYYAVGHWNSYFDAFLYLNTRELYPLQLFLREILVANTITEDVDPELMTRKQGLADVLKYSLIIVASVPVLVIYPLVQKFFAKGVMIGSLKG